MKRQGDSQASAARTGVPKPHLSTRVPQEDTLNASAFAKPPRWNHHGFKTGQTLLLSSPSSITTKKDTLYNKAGGLIGKVPALRCKYIAINIKIGEESQVCVQSERLFKLRRRRQHFKRWQGQSRESSR